MNAPEDVRHVDWPICPDCRKATCPDRDSAANLIEYVRLKYIRIGEDPNRPRPIRAYECPTGDGWHVTSKGIRTTGPLPTCLDPRKNEAWTRR